MVCGVYAKFSVCIENGEDDLSLGKSHEIGYFCFLAADKSDVWWCFTILTNI